MKKLNDFKEEIHKCSKCGLCQSVCPVYEQTGNDCTVSRGKFIMLNGIVKGDLKLNKNINKYLDMCLKCNACKNFCPSGIDARKIFTATKSDYFNACPNSYFIKVFHSKVIFKTFLNLVKFATNTYRGLRIDKLVKIFYPILYKLGWIGKKVILANEFVAKASHLPFTIHHPPKQQIVQKQIEVLYFKGCVNEYINPKTKIATENILSKLGVEIMPVNFDCCGVPFLSSGNTEQFKKQAEFNISQIPDDFAYFLTDCASCQNAFFEYEQYIKDEKLLEKFKKINEKSLNVVDFILENITSIEFDKKTTFTFHKPCHMEDISLINTLISKSKNLEYIQMEEFDKCCGFAGEFAIKNPKLSEKISTKKIKNATKTKADYILTSCPACVLGLTQGLVETKEINSKSLMNIVEFISQADKIK